MGIEGAAEPPPNTGKEARFAIDPEGVPREPARTEAPSRPLASVPLPSEPQNAEPTDAELERGILDAVKLGLGDVARRLSERLEARQRAAAGNVVALDPRRGRGR